jgi:flagellar biosynthesis protein FlhF
MMQIKRFEARNMTEALRLVKKEFGGDAVILSARNLKKAGGFFSHRGGGGVEITAAVDPGADPPTACPAAADPGAPVDPAVWQAQHQAPQDVVDLNQNRRLMGLFAFGRKARPAPSAPLPEQSGNDGDGLVFLQRLLVRQTVAPAIVTAWLAKARMTGTPAQSSTEAAARWQLQRLIAAEGLAAQPLRLAFGRQKTLAMVGPAGVGKTTICAKLAAIHRLAGHKVALVCCDQQRVAASAQLGAYARIMEAAFRTAATRAELTQVMKNLKSMDLIIIDTAGVSPRDPDLMADLVHLFARLKGVEVRLVLSAATRSDDLATAVDAFRRLELHSLVFTKLDETACHGSLVNAMVRGRLGASYLSAGQQVPEDLAAATPQALADLLFGLPPKDDAPMHAAPAPDRPPIQPPSWTAVGGQSAVFVANRTSDVFHRPHCKAVGRIKPENVRVFHSQAEAVDAKYKPCRTCVVAKAAEPFARILHQSMAG